MSYTCCIYRLTPTGDVELPPCGVHHRTLARLDDLPARATAAERATAERMVEDRRWLRLLAWRRMKAGNRGA